MLHTAMQHLTVAPTVSTTVSVLNKPAHTSELAHTLRTTHSTQLLAHDVVHRFEMW